MCEKLRFAFQACGCVCVHRFLCRAQTYCSSYRDAYQVESIEGLCPPCQLVRASQAVDGDHLISAGQKARERRYFEGRIWMMMCSPELRIEEEGSGEGREGTRPLAGFKSREESGESDWRSGSPTLVGTKSMDSVELMKMKSREWSASREDIYGEGLKEKIKWLGRKVKQELSKWFCRG